MQLNKDEFEIVREAWSKATEDNPWVMVEEGDWIQDGKYQNQTCIVQDSRTGRHYSFDIRRSGSPFSDWYYPHEDEEEFWLTEVVSQTRTIIVTEWVEGSPTNSTYIEADVDDYETFRFKLPDGFYEKHYEALEKLLENNFTFEWYFRGCLMNEEALFEATDLEPNTPEENRDKAIDMLLERCEDMPGMEELTKALQEI